MIQWTQTWHIKWPKLISAGESYSWCSYGLHWFRRWERGQNPLWCALLPQENFPLASKGKIIGLGLPSKPSLSPHLFAFELSSCSHCAILFYVKSKNLLHQYHSQPQLCLEIFSPSMHLNTYKVHIAEVLWDWKKKSNSSAPEVHKNKSSWSEEKSAVSCEVLSTTFPEMDVLLMQRWMHSGEGMWLLILVISGLVIRGLTTTAPLATKH